MVKDSAYFLRRAAEARALASSKEPSESVAAAGELALAYAALARRRARQAEQPAIPLEEPA